MITGQFNECGYTVFSDGEEIYSAGNHWADSQASVPPGSVDAVPLATLRRFCASTAKDMAKERRERYGGVEYCPE